MTRTKQRARQLVFWPKLTTDIENAVCNCAVCRQQAPSQSQRAATRHWRSSSEHPPWVNECGPILLPRIGLLCVYQWRLFIKMATDWQVSEVGDTCTPAAGPGRGRAVQIEWISAWTAHLGFPALLSVPHLLVREIMMNRRHCKTGWPCVAKIGRSSSSSDIICALRRWFPDVGVPTTLCTDGGPQFSSRKFQDFCERWNFQHVTSSLHYPRSNGHAEAAVKAMKSLVSKMVSNGNLNVDAFQRGLLEWRNTPAACGRSPAQHVFDRPLLSFLSAYHRSFCTLMADCRQPPLTLPRIACAHSSVQHTIGTLAHFASLTCKTPGRSCSRPPEWLSPLAKIATTLWNCPVVECTGAAAVLAVRWFLPCHLIFNLPPLYRHRQPSLVVAVADANTPQRLNISGQGQFLIS